MTPVFTNGLLDLYWLLNNVIKSVVVTDTHMLGVILISIFGNGVISVFLIYSLRPLRQKLKGFVFFNNIFKKLDARVQKKGKMIKNVRFWGLVMFVGIPLPVTGAWTGSFAAVFFNIDPRESVPAILLGLLLSASIVSILVLFTDFYIQNKVIYI